MFAISQKPQDSVNGEDLEILQTQLERCLMNTVIKKWEIQQEMVALSGCSPDRSVTPQVSKVASTSSSPAERPQPNGKLRNSLRHNHLDVCENSSDGLPTISSITETTIDAKEPKPNKKQLGRISAPDKLWPFVEQFCATPTEEQIKDLEEMIEASKNDKESFRIPVFKEPPKNLGALTQRLVSSFIETETLVDTPQQARPHDSRSRNVKTLDVNMAKKLEKRIRYELEECDILDQKDDIPFNSEDDEMLRELLISQHELLSIQTHNQLYMQSLLREARRQVKIDAERKKLQDANVNVVAANRRSIIARQKKRNLTKKEKDMAVKALKIHEAIFKKCDEMYLRNES